jgi:hypothetical protein
MTKLTKEIALSSIFHKNMIPTMSIMIIAIRVVTIKAVYKSNDSRINVHRNIAVRDEIN